MIADFEKEIDLFGDKFADLMRPRILHIDDDAEFLELFKAMFCKWFIISSAINGKLALEMLSKNKYDAVVTDFDIPDIDGVKLLKIIKSSFTKIPVYFYTGQGNDNVARDAFLAGVDGYFEKNFDEIAHKEKIVNSILKSIDLRRMRNFEARSRENFENLIDNFNEIIFFHDIGHKEIGHRLRRVNKKACIVLEYSEKQLLEKELGDVVSIDYIKKISQICNSDNVYRQEVLSFKAHVISKRGFFIPVEVNAYIYREENEIFVLSLARDISFQISLEKRFFNQEKRLLLSRKIYRIAYEEFNEVNFIKKICKALVKGGFCRKCWLLLLDKDKNFLAAESSGIDRFSVSLKNLKDNIYLPCIIKAEEKENFIWIKMKAEECRGCPLINYGFNCNYVIRLEYCGKLYGFLVFEQNNSSLLIEEEILKISTDLNYAVKSFWENRKRWNSNKKNIKYQKYFNALKEIIIILDTNQKVIKVNKKALSILNCSKKDILGDNFINRFVPDEHIQREKERFNNMIESSSQGYFSFKFRILLKDGTKRLILWSAYPIRNKDRVEEILYVGSISNKLKSVESGLNKIEKVLILNNCIKGFSEFNCFVPFHFFSKSYFY